MSYTATIELFPVQKRLAGLRAEVNFLCGCRMSSRIDKLVHGSAKSQHLGTCREHANTGAHAYNIMRKFAVHVLRDYLRELHPGMSYAQIINYQRQRNQPAAGKVGVLDGSLAVDSPGAETCLHREDATGLSQP